MRPLLILVFTFFASQSAAHVGHIADVAGHGHWIGAAAIGLAVLVGLYGKSKGKKEDAVEDEETPEGDEAPA